MKTDTPKVTPTTSSLPRWLQVKSRGSSDTQKAIITQWITEVRKDAEIAGPKQKEALAKLTNAVITTIYFFNQTELTPKDSPKRDSAIKNLNDAIDEIEEMNQELPYLEENKYSRNKIYLTITTFGVSGLLEELIKEKNRSQEKQQKTTPNFEPPGLSP